MCLCQTKQYMVGLGFVSAAASVSVKNRSKERQAKRARDAARQGTDTVCARARRSNRQRAIGQTTSVVQRTEGQRGGKNISQTDWDSF